MTTAIPTIGPATTDAVPASCAFDAAPALPGQGLVISINISPGGIPRLSRPDAWLTVDGLVGDGRNHAKHVRRERAISLLDDEIIEWLGEQGFAIVPGAIGENLTVRGVGVQPMPPGTLLQIGEIIVRLEEPRKPCYVLDAIDPRLKDVLQGRCGYMASVVRGGLLLPGAPVSLLDGAAR